MKLDEETYLAHYGIRRKSGRYPWGSGDTPHQRSRTFLDTIDEMKKSGMSESKIAAAFNTKEDPFSVSDLRALKSISTNIQKQEQIRTAQKLKDKGLGNSAIARQMGLNESSVRSLLEPGRQDRLDVLQTTAEMLKRQVAEKGLVDVGANVERDLPIGLGENPGARHGISADKFKVALSMLKEDGYGVHDVYIRQVGTGEITRYKVLAPPGMTRTQVFANREKIRQISEKSDDGGRSFKELGFKPPLNIDPKRVGVRYKEEGGADADGVIYVRPGVPDVSLGKSRYAQVRIAVGGTHYLKGMAVYKDDLPAGVDLQFNTNKSKTGNHLDAMKPLKTDKVTGKVDQENPFGAVIKLGGQQLDGKGKPKSVMNIVNEEGDWDKWSRTISAQVLSKQTPDVAEAQLSLTRDRRRDEFAKIMELTNPQVKKKLLEGFADETDSAAVHLKAANMPRQANKVLLPSNKVKPTEIYAPTFKNGEKVVLLRYPHAGTFEIPELTVNNKTKEAQALVGVGKGKEGTARDVVVIHPKVAERLSGADFDGDSVVVIPNDRRSISHTPPLDRLKGFDPQQYKVPKGPVTKEHPDGTPIIKSARKQQEMGDVTNLISDMTIRGASFSEIANAVRHSMVVIDSEKHNLDFKASARDHGIINLKRKYQGVHTEGKAKGKVKGAATLTTRAGSQQHVLKRKPASTKDRPDLARVAGATVERATGKKVWEYTGEKNPDGKATTQRSKKLAETDDAFTLVSDSNTRIERIYASHSNELKALANQARKELVATKNIESDPSAKKVYAHEVASLDAKLNTALKNSPLERQAQVVANQMVAQKRRDNPGMENDEVRKLKGMALTEARLRTGADKTRIGSVRAPITDREWQAIQNGAISSHKLNQILTNSDLDAIRERATPRTNPVMTPAISTRAQQMVKNGFTLEEISDALGVKLSTLSSSLEGE